jgi:predicted outer membrane repeat protein
MRQNFVEGGYNTRGGAISAQFARVDIHRVMFVGNEALGSSPGPSCSRSTLFVEGGAAYFMSTSVVTISSTRFEANRVGGASEDASGAAMSVGRLVSVDLRGSFFARNAAFRGGRTTSGGSVQISQEGKLEVTKTTFEENLVSGLSASSGGAIHADGSVVLQAGVEFHGNVVEGELSSDGGALYVRSTGTVSSTGLPGPIFTNNTVRKWLLLTSALSVLSVPDSAGVWH